MMRRRWQRNIHAAPLRLQAFNQGIPLSAPDGVSLGRSLIDSVNIRREVFLRLVIISELKEAIFDSLRRQAIQQT